MDSDLRALAKSFRPGYKLEPLENKQHRWWVIGPDGARVERADGHGFLILGKADTPQALQRVRSFLVQSGVLDPPRKSERGEHERRGGAPEAIAKVPFVLAQEVLNHTSSTPRERALAREVIRLHDELEATQVELTRVRHSAQVFYERFTPAA